MKKTIIAAMALAATLVAGCVSECQQCQLRPDSERPEQRQKQSSFSDEHFVWESWAYGTNRVEQTK